MRTSRSTTSIAAVLPVQVECFLAVSRQPNREFVAPQGAVQHATHPRFVINDQNAVLACSRAAGFQRCNNIGKNIFTNMFDPESIVGTR